MAVTHVEVLVEEASMEAALRLLLPRVLTATTFEIYPYQCKSDLLSKLPDRLGGYAKWLPLDWRVLVAVDLDSADCQELKNLLEAAAQRAGLITRTRDRDRYQVVNRVVIEELEAWYFGDWDAVRRAYPRVAEGIPRKARYRNPDAIVGGTWEAFEQILQRSGYFRGGLRKIEAARAIAAHWTPAANSSRSFQMFYHALTEMAS